MIRISLCMIVKNEEKVLKRCLDSVADLVDELIIVDVYAAGEDPISGVNSAKLAEGIQAATGQKVLYIPRLYKAEEYLQEQAKAGDLIMTIGAGDVFKIGEELVKELERNAK